MGPGPRFGALSKPRAVDCFWLQAHKLVAFSRLGSGDSRHSPSAVPAGGELSGVTTPRICGGSLGVRQARDSWSLGSVVRNLQPRSVAESEKRDPAEKGGDDHWEFVPDW